MFSSTGMRTPNRPACGLVTILAELTQLLSKYGIFRWRIKKERKKERKK
jgi:hypothetical protein